MPQTEMLRPDGNSRIVVDDSELDAFVAAGYIVIDASDEKVNLSLHQAGLAPEPKAAPEAEKVEEPDVDAKPKADAVQAISSDSKAKDAIAAVAELDSVEAVEAYVDGDERSTVSAAAEARIDALQTDPE